MTKELRERILMHKLKYRLNAFDKVKWVTHLEIIARYGNDIHPIQLELLLENDELLYPVNE